jgi:protocatechuate 3,4-dioxygenase alpha subunit
VTAARTPSQTVGPFFELALPWREGPWVMPEGAAGAIQIRGRLLDGRGDPVPDGLIETWQADSRGRLPHLREAGSPAGSFRGFGRCATDPEGWYKILTSKPGPIRDWNGILHAPHILVSVFARGLLKRAVTRIYFPDEPSANEADSVLASIGEASARATLIAATADGGYRFDIRLQGQGETVFFDI